ncbi:3348_t:CDS:1, partial [Dentiscutata erythropus]
SQFRKHTNASTVFGSKLVRLLSTILLAKLKIYFEDTLVAGIAKKSRAILDKFGNQLQFNFYQLSAFVSFEVVGSFKYC